jgi:FAD:protein FMN transferase
MPSSDRPSWTAGAARHHLLDPRTGLPVDNGLDTVTVVAGSAWVAEVLSKAAFVAGPEDGPTLLASANATGLLVTGPGRVRGAGRIGEFLAAAAPATA